MLNRQSGWLVLLLSIVSVAIGATWLQAESGSRAGHLVPSIRSTPAARTSAGDYDEYTEGLRSDQEMPVGTPQALPFVTTLLSSDEIEQAGAIALTDDDFLRKLADHRYEIVEAEKCGDKEGACSRLGFFDYDAGVCWHVFVDSSSEAVSEVVEGGCSPSDGEIAEARAIAESDPRVQKVLDDYDDEQFIEWGRGIVPREPGAQDGHRYVGVRWNLDGGIAVAEFVVDLTTRTVCYEC